MTQSYTVYPSKEASRSQADDGQRTNDAMHDPQEATPIRWAYHETKESSRDTVRLQFGCQWIQLSEKWNSKDRVCEGSGRKWLQGNPGLLTAECLKSMGVDPVDSRDAQKRHVFHAFGLVRVVKNSVDEWYHAKHEELSKILGEDEVYHHALQKGEACCSSRSASFHYVEAAETMAL